MIGDEILLLYILYRRWHNSVIKIDSISIWSNITFNIRYKMYISEALQELTQNIWTELSKIIIPDIKSNFCSTLLLGCKAWQVWNSEESNSDNVLNCKKHYEKCTLKHRWTIRIVLKYHTKSYDCIGIGWFFKTQQYQYQTNTNNIVYYLIND